MDFTRGSRPANAGTSEAAANTTTKRASRKNLTGGMGGTWIVFLVLIACLLLSLVFFVVLGSREESKNTNVLKDKYQAVFLTNGQVYFGRISEIGEKTVSLRDIFYLRPTQSVQPSDKEDAKLPDFTLVKLGCELHGPQDFMTIERSQLSFWENLKDDGQVVKGIKQIKEQNPDGVKCETAAKKE